MRAIYTLNFNHEIITETIHVFYERLKKRTVPVEFKFFGNLYEKNCYKTRS